MFIKYILDKLGDNPNPLAIQAIDYAELALNTLNKELNKYDRWQLVLLSVLITYLGMKFWYFYIDLEKGMPLTSFFN